MLPDLGFLVLGMGCGSSAVFLKGSFPYPVSGMLSKNSLFVKPFMKKKGFIPL